MPPSTPPAALLGAAAGGGEALGGGALVAVLAVIVVLVVLAGFFAMAETALTRMNRIKAVTFDEEGKKGSKALLRVVEQPERFLNPILLLVLLCHTLMATLVGALTGPLGAAGIAVGYVLELVVIFVLAESGPKTFAVQRTERAALFAAPFVVAVASFPPVRLLTRGLIGLSNILIPGKGSPTGPSTSEEELLALANVAEDEDVIEMGERKLIHSIIEFGDTVVREVMVARPDMVAVDSRSTVTDAVEIALTAGYSRIPVHSGTVDDVLGLAFLKDLARAERGGQGDAPIADFVRPATIVPEVKRVSELLREMQRDRFHMAIAVDEHGGVAGLVTMEDLIEELVGEIVDEYDVEEERVQRQDDGSALVAGATPVDEVNEALGLAIPEDDDYDTLGGYLFHRLGEVPSAGTSVDHHGATLTVRAMAGNRIDLVHVEPADDGSVAAGGDGRGAEAT